MRYAVFAWTVYYPLGGWRDFYGFAGTFEEAQALAEKAGSEEHETDDDIERWEIVDLVAGEAIEGAVSHTIYDEGDYYPPGKYWQRYNAKDEEEAREAYFDLMHKLTPRGTVFDRNKG